ncbi:ABC transporter permease [Falsirhodobacter halotolerans]|uniref:ABC transporter permease n=1 Tax=Falsirhodobacter halotolerans TaxID=1146892 RepID=UPI001FD0B661|nr:FtsX-like permease family protein [Falsirhodobacter halotolerans]MCJ8138637.1 ABC transporter permease [Falsirhodobacter halotolerans]
MTGTVPMALRIARREMRGGLRGFRIFLLCLILGVAAIAAVGTVRSAIENGIAAQGAQILGGNAEMSFTYREADATEMDFMEARSDRVSTTIEMRSMAGIGDSRVLTQLRGVDGLYPMFGAVTLDPAMPIGQAFAGDDLPGAVMDPTLAARLGATVGDEVTLAGRPFRLMALLRAEPDASFGGLSWAPRTLVGLDALRAAGFLAPGTVFDADYRLDLPDGTDLEALKAEALRQFSDTGMRWRDERRPSSSTERFVDQMAAFLTLMGLAGLAVGGVGIQAATAAWVARRVPTLATLRVLGATGRTILLASALQVGVLAGVGVLGGLALGAALPMLMGGWLAASLPFPVQVGLYPGPLLQAAVYGVLVAALFTLWPLARVADLRAASLYRGGTEGRPPLRYAVALVVLAAALIGAAAVFTGDWKLTLGMAGGIAGTMVVLLLAVRGVQALAHRAARRVRRPSFRVALASVGEGAGLRNTVLSLGLGLGVLAAVGQIDLNLRQAIDRDLPTRAPSHFFVDVQPDQVDAFLARLEAAPKVTEVAHAPMLRGVLTRINGRPAREVGGDHWVLRGDRGLTYADTPAEEVIAGDWWAADYTGPPQVSFGATEAAEIGIGLGDTLTINVLGRDIEATITSLRELDFSDAGLGFVMVLNPAALAGAPHTNVVTIHSQGDIIPLLNELGREFPNVTSISVGDAIARVMEIMGAVATATRAAAAITLAAGLAVLIGAAAAAQRARLHEAAVLKVLGATRAWILANFALRAALMGLVAGGVAALAGAVAAWAVMRFVLESTFVFAPWSALMIIGGGVAATLLASALFAWRPLSARPARILREG